MRSAVATIVAAVALFSGCTLSNRVESPPPDPAAALSTDREHVKRRHGYPDEPSAWNK
jgi:hypothetical protein